jgi:hypothetical protein
MGDQPEIKPMSAQENTVEAVTISFYKQDSDVIPVFDGVADPLMVILVGHHVGAGILLHPRMI